MNPCQCLFYDTFQMARVRNAVTVNGIQTTSSNVDLPGNVSMFSLILRVVYTKCLRLIMKELHFFTWHSFLVESISVCPKEAIERTVVSLFKLFCHLMYRLCMSHMLHGIFNIRGIIDSFDS